MNRFQETQHVCPSLRITYTISKYSKYGKPLWRSVFHANRDTDQLNYGHGTQGSEDASKGDKISPVLVLTKISCILHLSIWEKIYVQIRHLLLYLLRYLNLDLHRHDACDKNAYASHRRPSSGQGQKAGRVRGHPISMYMYNIWTNCLFCLSGD